MSYIRTKKIIALALALFSAGQWSGLSSGIVARAQNVERQQRDVNDTRETLIRTRRLTSRSIHWNTEAWK